MTADPGAHREQLGELFAEGPSDAPPPRVLALVVKPVGYRDVAADIREVHFRRRARCASCHGEGECRRCDGVGWRLVPETIKVTVPTGAAIGTLLRIAGKGDDEPSRRAVGFVVLSRVQDLHLELVEPGERADLLAAAARMHDESLAAEWHTASARRRATARKNGLALIVTLCLLAIGGLYLTMWR